jgi:hypothetical protein
VECRRRSHDFAHRDFTASDDDKRQAGDPSDGGIARRQVAEVFVRSLRSDHALRKTFELVAETGSTPNDFDALFAPLDADLQAKLDGVHDMANMPLEDEPQRVREDLNGVAHQFVTIH